MMQHGAGATYSTGCRCLTCRCEHARRRQRQRRLGITLVSVSAVRTHLRRKLCGMGPRHIAKLAHVSERTVKRILGGKTRRVRAATATRLLAVRRVLAPRALVSSWRTRKLVKALEAEGWTTAEIARSLHLWRGGIARSVTRRRVEVHTARLIERFYQAAMAEGYDATLLRRG